jgi:hypothetical protein
LRVLGRQQSGQFGRSSKVGRRATLANRTSSKRRSCNGGYSVRRCMRMAQYHRLKDTIRKSFHGPVFHDPCVLITNSSASMSTLSQDHTYHHYRSRSRIGECFARARTLVVRSKFPAFSSSHFATHYVQTPDSSVIVFQLDGGHTSRLRIMSTRSCFPIISGLGGLCIVQQSTVMRCGQKGLFTIVEHTNHAATACTNFVVMWRFFEEGHVEKRATRSMSACSHFRV